MSSIDDVAAALVGIGSDLRSTLAGGGIEIVVGGDAVGSVEILRSGIVDSAVAVGGGKVAVHTCDEHCLAQIAEVWHQGLFVGYCLLDNVSQFGGAGDGEATVIHFRHIVTATEANVGKVGNDTGSLGCVGCNSDAA